MSQPQSIKFDRVETRIDNPKKDGSVNHYSICVFLDEESNERILDWVGRVEDKIGEAGVELSSRRKDQEPFHSTLAVVDGRSYPVEEVMAKINSLIPPGNWTSNLTLTKPQW